MYSRIAEVLGIRDPDANTPLHGVGSVNVDDLGAVSEPGDLRDVTVGSKNADVTVLEVQEVPAGWAVLLVEVVLGDMEDGELLRSFRHKSVGPRGVSMD